MRIASSATASPTARAIPRSRLGRPRDAARQRTRRAELTGYNLGIRRDRSDQIHARWRAEVEARLPAEHEGRVVFAFGANDAVQEIAPAVTLGHGEAMLTEARARWPVFLARAGTLGRGQGSGAGGGPGQGAGGALWAARRPYASVFDGLMATSLWLDEARAGDGAHPGAGGYRRFAEIILASEAWRDWML